jgi:hypothetical protein
MGGSREQRVVFRFHQIQCSGLDRPEPLPNLGASLDPACALVGTPGYYDTFWWSAGKGRTDQAGPVSPPTAGSFYETLLESRRWWDAELAAEGMMELSLPSPASTNGTWLITQAVHNLVLSMIIRHEKWGPRYGVLPGYGITMQEIAASDIINLDRATDELAT